VTEVLRNNTDIVPGLYAAGEVACVSVHGSNRLGTNSLLDINVFGRRAGIAAAEYAVNAAWVELPDHPSALVDGMVESIRTRESGERVADVRKALQETMDRNVQVFRTEASMKEALGVIDELKERYATIVVQDKGKRYNTDLLEAVELGFLIELAEVITLGALARKESRGGHFREDYEARDDINFMRHTMAYRPPVADVANGPEFASEIRLDYKPVTVTRYQPMERKY
jgi:succinate dehydrogenase / fumarate reductase flavoprotein subunit